ncbi:MAG TPA: sulfatase-like hydrolase/transferase [Longimicrobium sp.]|nr:sulfatase-like hydrolase/transferase [Longimicrobium sp.]
MAWKDLPAKPNIVLIITDQQRSLQHWPSDWVATHLPNMQRLIDTGMTFTNAFSAANECSPSRATFVTSTYDTINKIWRTAPPQNLPTQLPNLATVLQKAGYQTNWRGKWHLLAQPASNLDAYGFAGWDPPDAGTSLGNDSTLGGGHPDNDGRYAADAVTFLQNYTSSDPFLLVVSLVNPHDVHVYTEDWVKAGYPSDIPDMGVGLPGNYDDPLTAKPGAQLAFRDSFDSSSSFKFDPPNTTHEGYVNFYAYLQTVVDQEIGKVLCALHDAGFTDNTLVVRMADHGEMGMSHKLREKMYVAYDEAIHVPLIFSNPRAFPQGVTTDAFASLLDLVPTLASVAGLPAQDGLLGKDLTPVLSGTQPSVQDAVLYVYDDQYNVDDSVTPTHIRAVRTAGWMYSVYFSESNPELPPEFELYDMAVDPGQLTNLLNPANFDPAIVPTWVALNTQLFELMLQNEASGPAPGLPASAELGLALLEAAKAPGALVSAAGEPWLEGK